MGSTYYERGAVYIRNIRYPLLLPIIIVLPCLILFLSLKFNKSVSKVLIIIFLNFNDQIESKMKKIILVLYYIIHHFYFNKFNDITNFTTIKTSYCN